MWNALGTTEIYLHCSEPLEEVEWGWWDGSVVRAFAVLVEDLNWAGDSKMPTPAAPEDPMSSSGLGGNLNWYTHIHIQHIHIHSFKVFRKNKGSACHSYQVSRWICLSGLQAMWLSLLCTSRLCDHAVWTMSRLAINRRHTCDLKTELDEQFGLKHGRSLCDILPTMRKRMHPFL